MFDLNILRERTFWNVSRRSLEERHKRVTAANACNLLTWTAKRRRKNNTKHDERHSKNVFASARNFFNVIIPSNAPFSLAAKSLLVVNHSKAL